nr:histidine kinase [Kribbella sandramycini]
MILEIVLLAGLTGEELVRRIILEAPQPGEALYFASGFVVAALALLRRRYPERLAQLAAAAISVSLVCSAIGYLLQLEAPFAGDAEALALFLLVGACCHRLLPRPAAALAVLGGLAVTAAPKLRYGDQEPALTIAIVWAMLWGAAVAIGLILRDSVARREAALAAARNRERLALARELHDLVAHHITGVVVRAQAAQVVGGDQEMLGEIEKAGAEALAAVRSLVTVLRSPEQAAPTAGGLAEAVETVVEGNELVTVRMAPGLAELPVAAVTVSTVHRVLLESLTNVRRHAPDARRIAVDLTAADGYLRVAIHNDGVRPTRGRRTADGYGLIGMRERIDALGGRLVAGEDGDRGWQVLAELPLPEEES